MKKTRIGVVGCTGSIGVQAHDIITRNPERFEVVFLATHRNIDLMQQQAAANGAKILIATADGNAPEGVLVGMDELVKVIRNEQCDLILMAAVGAAGIVPTHAALDSGIDVALANKESIVAAGTIMKDTAKKRGASIIPVDSEHSAVYQCLMGQDSRFVKTITLTASGGAFRHRPADSLEHVSVEEALKHPNWTMGSKITVDSATMMNKGLELIEARYLFDVEPSKLDVVIHPESIIHSMVSFTDGSMLAQLGNPDMRVPIGFALGFPDRIETGVAPIDLAELGKLTFLRPDLKKYACLSIAMEVLSQDLPAGMIGMNAANEIAVEAFIGKKVNFTDIPHIIEESVSAFSGETADTLAAVLDLDARVRRYANRYIQEKLGS